MLNTSSNLYKAEWLDLVFKGRNKNYGAYLLRSESAGIQMKALLIAASLFISFFVIPMVVRKLQPEPVADQPRGPIEARELLPPVEMTKLKEETAAAAKIDLPKEKLKMVRIPSKVVVVEHTTVDPPTLKDMENAIVGPVTQDGLETKQVIALSEGDGTGISGNGNGKGTEVDNTIYNNSEGLQVYPEFEGGMKAWAKYIQRNLRYPYRAQELDVQGKVFISFVIERDGSVSNVTVMKGIGAGCDEEAARVIAKSPKWKPGKQNDQAVRVRYTIPIGFAMQ